MIATTHNLLVYGLPGSSSKTATDATPSTKKNKKKSKAGSNGHSLGVKALELLKTIDLPSSTGQGSTFRAAKYVSYLSYENLTLKPSNLLDSILRMNQFSTPP